MERIILFMKKFSKYIAFLLIIFSLASCTYKNSNNTEDEQDKLPSFGNGGGVSLGLYNINGNIETKYIFNVKQDEILKKYISISNQINENREYKLILFVNFKQHKFSVDNKPQSEEYTFSMKPNQSLKIPVEVNQFDSGLNDVIFVLIKYSNVKSLNNEFRANTDMNHLLFVRFNVANNNDQIPKYKIENFKSVESNNILDGVFISKSRQLKRWLSDKINPGEFIKYYIDIGNLGSKEQTYALISLFDWKQINIDDENNVVFFRLDKNKKISIPTSFKVPNIQNTYDLTTILIYNPYQKLDMYNRTVETPIRVGIDVNR